MIVNGYRIRTVPDEEKQFGWGFAAINPKTKEPRWFQTLERAVVWAKQQGVVRKNLTPDELGSLLRTWRDSWMINTEEAGEWLGISGRTVENIESGRSYRNPRLLALAIYCLLENERHRDPLKNKPTIWRA